MNKKPKNPRCLGAAYIFQYQLEVKADFSAKVYEQVIKAKTKDTTRIISGE